MDNFIVITIILLIVGSASLYIIKAKKSGKKCIGCPDGCSCHANKKDDSGSACGGNCSTCSGCNSNK